MWAAGGHRNAQHLAIIINILRHLLSHLFTRDFSSFAAEWKDFSSFVQFATEFNKLKNILFYTGFDAAEAAEDIQSITQEF